MITCLLPSPAEGEGVAAHRNKVYIRPYKDMIQDSSLYLNRYAVSLISVSYLKQEKEKNQLESNKRTYKLYRYMCVNSLYDSTDEFTEKEISVWRVGDFTFLS